MVTHSKKVYYVNDLPKLPKVTTKRVVFSALENKTKHGNQRKYVKRTMECIQNENENKLISLKHRHTQTVYRDFEFNLLQISAIAFVSEMFII